MGLGTSTRGSIDKSFTRQGPANEDLLEGLQMVIELLKVLNTEGGVTQTRFEVEAKWFLNTQRHK